MELISVILPTYNSEKTIRRTIDSIFNQEGLGDFFQIQVIVVDDCSTDGTWAILDSYKNIEIYSNKVNSGGPNMGRNVGLSKVKGEWIMFIDHDDEWLSFKVKEQLKLKQYKVVTCGFNAIKPSGESFVMRNTGEMNELIYPKNKSFLYLLSRTQYGQITYFGTLMIHNSLKNILFEEEFGICDYDYILKILHNNTTAQINFPLFNRYIDGENLSHNKRYRELDYQKSMQTYSFYQSLYPSEVTIGIQKLNAMMGRYYYSKGDRDNAIHYFKKSRLGLMNLSILLSLKTGLSKFFNLNLFKY
jgi:teichuronic acid biosynthesis glycosyltransferase TuaG